MFKPQMFASAAMAPFALSGPNTNGKYEPRLSKTVS